MTDATVSSGQAAQGKNRVPFWDNARFACVTLVVIGHATQRLTGDSDHALVLYLFIYAFHIPAFAIISGFFSKASPPTARQMKKVVTDILLPYVIMESIWSLVQFLVTGKNFNPTKPSWTLWFLLALGFFRLVLPYLALIKHPLVIATVFSVGVGYFSNVDSTFSLSRAIGILPFFLLGWKMRQWGIVDRWRLVDKQTWLIRGIAIAVFAIWAAALIVFIDVWRDSHIQLWFMYDDAYSTTSGQQWWAGFVRLGFMLLAVILSAAFFVLIPRRLTWFTQFGQATMYVYLLHSFILYPIRESGFLQGPHAAWPYLLAMVLIAIAISTVLSTTPVRKIFRPLIEPKPRWLFVTNDDEPVGSSRTDPTGSRRR
jgi:fucose 4-O-acetylase-like acetyltransferase